MGEIFLLVAFFVGLALGDDGKCVRWWRHWAAVSGRGGSGLGRRAGADCANVAQTVGQSQFGIPAVLAACGASLVGVLMLRFSFSTPGS